MTNRIIYGQTSQALRHIPAGVVSGASFTLEDIEVADDASTRVIASGACTVASWTATTSATAGATQSNAKRMSVTSTTGIALAVPAVITGADGMRELFEVAGFYADTYVEAASDLAGEYASGSTIAGVLVSASVPDVFAADEDAFKLGHALRVTWTYTLGGVLYRVPELVEFARHNERGDAFVGEVVIRLRKLYPEIGGTLGDGIEFDTIVALMNEQVADDLRAKGIPPENFMLGQRGRGLLEARVLMHAGEIGYSPGGVDQTTWSTAATRRYSALLGSATIGEPGHATAETDAYSDTTPGTPSHKYRGLTLDM